LLKKYDDVVVVKIADFGLVKVVDSDLTSASTNFKGYFNDPSLEPVSNRKQKSTKYIREQAA